MSDHPDLFTKLGGVRAIARVLGEAPSTVQSWKDAKRIPAHKQPGFIARYAETDVAITTDEIVFPFGREEAAA